MSLLYRYITGELLGMKAATDRASVSGQSEIQGDLIGLTIHIDDEKILNADLEHLVLRSRQLGERTIREI